MAKPIKSYYTLALRGLRNGLRWMHIAAERTARLTLRMRLLLAGVVFMVAIITAPVLTGSESNNPLSDLAGTSNDSSQGLIGAVTGPKNPLAGAKFYVDPQSSAAMQAVQWQTSRPDDARAMQLLAQQPMAKWLTSADSLDAELDAYIAAAAARDETAVFVLYNIPNRDCGLYSSGGAASIEEYQAFVTAFANRIKTVKAAVIVEPDAIANIAVNGDDDNECLSSAQRQEYLGGLKHAVSSLKAAGASVYIDAGNSGWVRDISRLALVLKQANIDMADGFSLNVSNFRTTDQSVSYGNSLSDELGGAHFVIDTSRNGLGNFENPDYRNFGWCNPPGRALGHYPTADTGYDRVDAFLYVKTPGESDGQDPNPKKCFDGPRAGEWWPDYALGLIQRWPKDLQPQQ